MKWNTHQSRSISPNLNPPSLDLPSVGCLVKFALGPVGRACILSITMCCLLAELGERSSSEARRVKSEEEREVERDGLREERRERKGRGAEGDELRLRNASTGGR
jgi:hypothetical protein